MNGGKFASLTAELLVRKGEARPSLFPAASVVNLPRPHAPAPGNEPPPAAAPPPTRRRAGSRNPAPPSPPEGSVKPRRLMIALTPSEFETLGHMSVKKGTTRHQLLRDALDEYMALLGEEYGGDCNCIYTGCSCDNPR